MRAPKCDFYPVPSTNQLLYTSRFNAVWCALKGVILEMKFASAVEEASREIGIDCLKPKQLEAIEAFVSGRDVFVPLPTGYGKSVIYAILPLLFDKL